MDVHSHEARTSDLPLPQSQTMLLHAFAGSDLISSQNSASPSEASPLPNFLQRQLFQKNLPRLYSFPANHIHRTLKFPSVSGLLLFSSFHSTTIMSTHGSLPILLVHFQEQHQHMIPQQSSLDHHLSPPPKCLLLLGHPSNLTQRHLQEMTESNSAILHAGI